MASAITTIRDAIVDAVNAGTFSQSVTASATWGEVVRMPGTDDDAIAYVWCQEVNTELHNRSDDRRTLTVLLELAKRVDVGEAGEVAEVDGLVLLLDEIYQAVSGLNEDFGGAQIQYQGCELAPVADVALLTEQKVYRGAVAFQFMEALTTR